MQVQSFGCISGEKPRILILGSMPGVASLQAQHYYAHPRNAFWPIMAQLLNAPVPSDWDTRYQWLTQHQIALWDVIGSCYREGSLDSAIQSDDLQLNPIASWLERQPTVSLIALNGAKAAQLFKRHLQMQIPKSITVLTLPSTSPANAASRFVDKLQQWQQLLTHLDE